MPAEALLLREVSHRFGDLEALSGVDLRVDEGEIYGFLGLNGAGKTTLIRLILGLIRPRTGKIRVLGAPVKGRPPEPFLEVGVLFEDFAAPPYLTGREQLYLQARLFGKSAVHGGDDFLAMARGLKPNDEAKLRVSREGKVIDVRLKAREPGSHVSKFHFPLVVIYERDSNKDETTFGLILNVFKYTRKEKRSTFRFLWFISLDFGTNEELEEVKGTVMADWISL